MMLLCNVDKTYKFVWAAGTDFENLRGMLETGVKKNTRVLSIATQKQRISLIVYTSKKLGLVPAVREDGSWVNVTLRNSKVEGVPSEVLESEESLKEFLVKQMVRQFEKSVEGFYEEYPAFEDIVAAVSEEPYASTLVSKKYNHQFADVQEDEEWDGAYQVYCQGGRLLIPYVGDPRTQDVALIVDYATFVSDNRVATGLQKFAGKVEDLVSSFSNWRWSALRRHIDEVWR